MVFFFKLLMLRNQLARNFANLRTLLMQFPTSHMLTHVHQRKEGRVSVFPTLSVSPLQHSTCRNTNKQADLRHEWRPGSWRYSAGNSGSHLCIGKTEQQLASVDTTRNLYHSFVAHFLFRANVFGRCYSVVHRGWPEIST